MVPVLWRPQHLVRRRMEKGTPSKFRRFEWELSLPLHLPSRLRRDTFPHRGEENAMEAGGPHPPLFAKQFCCQAMPLASAAPHDRPEPLAKSRALPNLKPDSGRLLLASARVCNRSSRAVLFTETSAHAHEPNMFRGRLVEEPRGARWRLSKPKEKSNTPKTSPNARPGSGQGWAPRQ